MRVRSGQAHWIHQVSSRKYKNILAYRILYDLQPSNAQNHTNAIDHFSCTVQNNHNELYIEI